MSYAEQDRRQQAERRAGAELSALSRVAYERRMAERRTLRERGVTAALLARHRKRTRSAHRRAANQIVAP
jgi:hypothetical protein